MPRTTPDLAVRRSDPDPDPVWRVDLGRPVTSSLRFGVLLREAPRRKELAVAVEAGLHGEPVAPHRGLTWSDSLLAHYCYFPTERRWKSRAVTYSRPVDRVAIRVLALPSREPLGPQDVLRVFALTPDAGPGTSAGLHLLGLGG